MSTTASLQLDETTRVSVRLFDANPDKLHPILARFYLRIRCEGSRPYAQDGLVAVIFRNMPTQAFLDDPTPAKHRRVIMLPPDASAALGACVLTQEDQVLEAAAWMLLRAYRGEYA